MPGSKQKLFRRGLLSKRRLVKDKDKKQLDKQEEPSLLKLEICSSTSNTSVASLDTNLTNEETTIGPSEFAPCSILIVPGTKNREPVLKNVSFDLDQNQLHQDCDENERTPEECAQCWYNDQDITAFRRDASNAAVQILGNKKRQLERKPTRYDSMSSQESNDSVSFADRATDFKQVIAEAYRQSNGICTEDGFYTGVCDVDTGDLSRAYQQFNIDEDDDICLIGLEVYILYGIRGESSRQVSYILDSVRQRLAKEGHGTRGNKNDYAEQRDKYMRLLSQYISLPSRVFVRELARAQASALSQSLYPEDDDDLL